jgi:uncharacterized SAM-binding protein YcdF (DUF218 family)
MLNLVKDSIQLNYFFGLTFLILVLITYYYSLKKTRWLWGILSILFLLSSTQIFPAYLVAKEEAKTPVCNPLLLQQNETYYLHVLGAGYNLDSSLPATSQLNTITLARLVEAIRLAQNLNKYKLITSGYAGSQAESQASVVKRAAMSLGIPKQNIEVLDTPSNTSEEVGAFVKKFGKNKKVIVVSDAMHLPRALMLYQKAGIKAIGAPTNFKIKKVKNDYNGFSFPSQQSISLMNSYLREQLKYFKDNQF